METKDVVGIIGAVTALIGVVPPVVGMFKSSAPVPQTVSCTTGAACNFGAGTINQNTIIAKYVDYWTAGIHALTNQSSPPRASETTKASSSGPTDALGPNAGNNQASPSGAIRSPISVQTGEQSAATQERQTETSSGSASEQGVKSLPVPANCIVACASADRSSCQIQAQDGNVADVAEPTFLADCSGIHLIRGKIEGLMWTPSAKRIYFDDYTVGQTIAANELISAVVKQQVDDECIFSGKACGRRPPVRGCVSIQGMLFDPVTRTIGCHPRNSDYEAATNEKDRREFVREDLGMIAALLRKGYFWDAAHFLRLQSSPYPWASSDD